MSASTQVRDAIKICPPNPEQIRKWLAAGSEVSRGIFKTPGVCGGRACAGKTRIDVSGLVEWKQLGSSDAEILSSLESLTQRDLDNAWEYARNHDDEIAREIQENNQEDE